MYACVAPGVSSLCEIYILLIKTTTPYIELVVKLSFVDVNPMKIPLQLENKGKNIFKWYKESGYKNLYLELAWGTCRNLFLTQMIN